MGKIHSPASAVLEKARNCDFDTIKCADLASNMKELAAEELKRKSGKTVNHLAILN